MYRKNCENIYEPVDSYDGVNTAIKHAKRRMAEFELVGELKVYLEEG